MTESEARQQSAPPCSASDPVRRVTPSFDAYEGSEALLFQFDLPGVTEEGLALRYELGRLELDATPPPGDAWAEPRRYVARLALPEAVDPESIEASLDHGVLTIKVPKSASARARVIPIQTAH